MALESPTLLFSELDRHVFNVVSVRLTRGGAGKPNLQLRRCRRRLVNRRDKLLELVAGSSRRHCRNLTNVLAAKACGHLATSLSRRRIELDVDESDAVGQVGAKTGDFLGDRGFGSHNHDVGRGVFPEYGTVGYRSRSAANPGSTICIVVEVCVGNGGESSRGF